LSFYEPGQVFGIKYSKDKFPPHEKIISHLNYMLDLEKFAIHRGGTDIDNELPVADHNQNEDTLPEKKKMRIHLHAERNQKLAREAKKIHGYTCQVCGINFEDMYGLLGKNYIEAHHLTPFSELPENEVVNLSPEKDFAVICSNCHSMLHRKGAPETFQAFRKNYGERISI
jgi:5-methylcytosine-specific restriction protein A